MNRIHAQRGLYRDKTAQTRIAALQFLADQPVTDRIQSGAAITLQAGSKQAHFGRQFPGISSVGKRPGNRSTSAISGSGAFFIDKSADTVTNHLLLVGELIIDIEEIQGVEADHKIEILRDVEG